MEGPGPVSVQWWMDSDHHLPSRVDTSLNLDLLLHFRCLEIGENDSPKMGTSHMIYHSKKGVTPNNTFKISLMEGRTVFCRNCWVRVTSGSSWGVYGYPPNACHSTSQGIIVVDSPLQNKAICLARGWHSGVTVWFPWFHWYAWGKNYPVISDMPPFKVTSAEVAIIWSEWCIFILRKTVWLGNTYSIAIWVRTGAYLSCIWPANEVMFLGMECTWCLIWRTPTSWKVWRNRSILFDILRETRGREGCRKLGHSIA